MAKRRKITRMSDDEVLNQVNHWLDDAINYNTSELSQQRANSLNYYFGMPFGNEQPGKSRVVTRDVQETVDWIMPSLMKVFTSGGQVVKYEPQTEADVPQAEQETEYVNYLFTRRNDGFKIMYDWFQDALLMKTGIVKVFVEEEEIPEFSIYSGITDEMVIEILSDKNSELIAQTDNQDGTYDIRVRTMETKRRIRVVCVNPENFFIERNVDNLDDSQFCAHREERTISWLRLNGVPEDVIGDLPYDTFEFGDSAPEKLARDAYDGSGDFAYHSGEYHESNRKVWVNECYVKLDVDGDGIAELRKITTVGNYIISNEEYDCMPFADITAHRIAHKFYGMSIYDKIHDLQELRSAIMRGIMDNIYRTNTGRFMAVEGQVNIEDLISNESAGVVRVKSLNALEAIATPQLSGEAYNMLDRLEADRAKRTGVSDQSRGLDANTLHSNQAAMSVNQVMTAAEQQIDLIARMFAETGVKRLFQLLHDFSIKYQDQQEVFQLRGQYVSVNPANWRKRSDLVVTVGIGNMNKDQQLMHLQRLFELTQMIVSNDGMGVLTSEKHIYNLLKEITENAGYKDVSKYWRDPDSPEAQMAQQQKAEAAAKPTPEDIKANNDQLRAQSDAQSKQMEAQLKMAEIELKKQEATVKLREIALKEQQMQLDREKFVWERARDEAEFVLEQEQRRAAALGDGKVPTTKTPRKKAENS